MAWQSTLVGVMYALSEQPCVVVLLALLCNDSTALSIRLRLVCEKRQPLPSFSSQTARKPHLLFGKTVRLSLGAEGERARATQGFKQPNLSSNSQFMTSENIYCMSPFRHISMNSDNDLTCPKDMRILSSHSRQKCQSGEQRLACERNARRPFAWDRTEVRSIWLWFLGWPASQGPQAGTS